MEIDMRKFGILLGISSLPGKYGIGSLGKSAYAFADFLKRSGVKVWQILPVNPTGYGNSPYQSFSTFAGNPYFIDLETLVDEDILQKSDLPHEYTLNNDYVDYGTLYEERYATLKKAFDYSYNRLLPEIEEFKLQNDWLYDYAIFMAIKDDNNGQSWQEWEDENIKKRRPAAIVDALSKHRERVEFYCFLQFLFYRQFGRFKAYVNSLGIELLGDIPIYVALDSADVWSNPEIFDLDSDLRPVKVAGVPPDYFCEDGQLWGNPIYNWEYLGATNYAWWIKRLRSATSLYDILRLDHFIGFARYYSVPFGEKTAKVGQWNEGVKEALFKEAEKQLGKLNIVAEDLGVLTDEVIALRESLGFPGMKVIQFCFDMYGDSTVLPSEVAEHSVIYTGTHDNDTLRGWLDSCSPEMRDFVLSRLGLADSESREAEVDGIVRACISSTAELAIVPIQDLLGLGSHSRINSPGTVGENWKWRLRESDLSDELSNRIFKNVEAADRL